jgi:hypothetical protein
MSDEQTKPDVAALIEGMQHQLTSIEKKIDMLVRQAPSAQPRDKFFPRPSRPFDHSHRPGQGSDNRGFGYKKKSFEGPREDSHGGGGESRGFGGKKKPFYYRGKGRG